MNAKMPQLKRAFEKAGFTEVKTLLSSGNVVFNATDKSLAAIERRAEAATLKELGRTFYTILRSTKMLRELVATDPYRSFNVPAGARKVVTFMRDDHDPSISFPVERDGARIVHSGGREAFTYYVAGDKGPVFMTLIEKTFGSAVTTRTWETVQKCADA